MTSDSDHLTDEMDGWRGLSLGRRRRGCRSRLRLPLTQMHTNWSHSVTAATNGRTNGRVSERDGWGDTGSVCVCELS